MTEYLAEQPEVATINTFDWIVPLSKSSAPSARRCRSTRSAQLCSCPTTDATTPVARSSIRPRLGDRRRRASALASADRARERVLSGAGPRRAYRHPGHTEPIVSDRDASMGYRWCSGCRLAWHTATPATSHVARNSETSPTTFLSGTVRVGATPDRGAMSALVRMARPHGRERAGRIRLAVLPRHGTFAQTPRALAVLPRVRGRAARCRAAAVALPALSEPAPAQGRGAESVKLIEIGGRNDLVYLIRSHPAKTALLSRDSPAKLDRLNIYWIPYSRRLIPSPARRCRVERMLGRRPMVRHAGAVLTTEARRRE